MLVATLAASLVKLAYAHAATAPKILTLRDSGKTVSVRKGEHLELRLNERYRWLKPRMRGGAVGVSRILFVRDLGYVAWSIAARARGKAVVTAVVYRVSSGSRCDPGPCSPHLFRVTLVVR